MGNKYHAHLGSIYINGAKNVLQQAMQVVDTIEGMLYSSNFSGFWHTGNVNVLKKLVKRSNVVIIRQAKMAKKVKNYKLHKQLLSIVVINNQKLQNWLLGNINNYCQYNSPIQQKCCNASCNYQTKHCFCGVLQLTC